LLSKPHRQCQEQVQRHRTDGSRRKRKAPLSAGEKVIPARIAARTNYLSDGDSKRPVRFGKMFEPVMLATI
jgi:hypothetical protein